jgi:hypothetical protein
VDRSDKEWTISSQQKKTKKRRDPQHDLSDSPSDSPAGPSRTTEGGAKDGPSAGGGGAKGRAGKRRKTAKKAEDEMVDSFEFDEVWDVEVSVFGTAGSHELSSGSTDSLNSGDGENGSLLHFAGALKGRTHQRV